MPMPVDRFGNSQMELYRRGCHRVTMFCNKNKLPLPSVRILEKDEWHVNACAYYRPTTINICLEHCGRPCPQAMSRNWTWPGSTTDREPYGVLCHELGHHVDWHKSGKKHSYFGDYGLKIKEAAREAPISGYCPNYAEWFAEMFRLFVTNHALLYVLRPRTHELIIADFTPVSGDNWLTELGPDVPNRVVDSLEKKMKVKV